MPKPPSTFADAAAVFPPGSSHETERMRYLDREEDSYYRQGDEFGDNAALQTAITRNMRLIELRPRARVPLEWARTQMNLGIALRTLGERESGTARLEEAVAAYRAALEERTQERVPRFYEITTQSRKGACGATTSQKVDWHYRGLSI